MSLIKRMTPINLLEEKAKFFDNNDYNPQFIYRQPIPERLLNRYGKIDSTYLELAKQIVKKAYFNRNQQDIKMTEGAMLSQIEVSEGVRTYLKLHGLNNRYQLSWSQSYVARTTITNNLIKLKLPCTYRKNELMGMMYHEIGTHALRRINYEKQPWYKKKKKYGFKNYLITEEGLASLHSLIPKNIQFAHAAALKYVMANEARQKSFSQIFKQVRQYLSQAENAWTFCVRLKRGITDTNQAGFNSKSLVYFAGIIQVWQWLVKHDFKLEPLYWGKIALDDVETAVQLNPSFSPQMPHFYFKNRDEYAQKIMKIGQVNQLDQLK